MKKFTLLVNGQDLDTGVYEYLPYVDKLITDFRGTRKIIRDLKENRISEKEAESHIYAKYCIGNEDTNRLAIESAYKASKEFQKFPFAIRKKIYSDLYELLLKNKMEFIDLLMIEGHPRKLAEWEFEGMRTGGCPETMNFYFKQIQKEIGKHAQEKLYWARKPDGVICVSSPGNASASNSYNAALYFLVGNTVIIKPPLRDPVSTIFLWKEIVNEALKRNKVPPGTVNIILGNSQVIMDEWLKSPFVNDVTYFGDSQKGLEIGEKAFQVRKKTILELSGNDMLLVWKDGDIEKATDSLLDCFLGSTQICMVPKVGVIHETIYSSFTKLFLEKVKKLKIGLPSDPEVVLSPVARIRDFSEFLNDSLEKGAKLIYGGERVNYLNEEDKNGIFIRPALLQINNYEDALSMR